MKLLLDMNIAPRWVQFLSAVGMQSIHWSSIGPANASDSDIMSYARSNDYIVLTQDLDFTSLLATTQDNKPSVVQIRADDTSPEAIGQNVIKALHQVENELANGALLTIDAKKVRLRILPFFTVTSTPR
ncbi:MAG: DUF5615 family PIN-like protein [Desulfovibrio sp.]|nr:DUF5615 family PIN-like protein [Desulfovibrio sp.]